MKKVLLIPALAVFMWGCSGNSSLNQDNHQDHAHPAAAESHDHHGEAQAGNVKTDNGKKWKANTETTEGIHQMIALIEQQEQGRISIAELRQGLDKEFNEVLQQCTMTGEAHNQLHNYLLPLKEQYERLDENSGKEPVKAVKDYLHTYGSYFE